MRSSGQERRLRYYLDRYREGTNVVLLEPDVAAAFHDADSVNAALRQYLEEHGAPPQCKR